MKRIQVYAAAFALALVPAVVGLWGNASFSRAVPVRIPSSAQTIHHPRAHPDEGGDGRSVGVVDERVRRTSDDLLAPPSASPRPRATSTAGGATRQSSGGQGSGRQSIGRQGGGQGAPHAPQREARDDHGAGRAPGAGDDPVVHGTGGGGQGSGDPGSGEGSGNGSGGGGADDHGSTRDGGSGGHGSDD